jgi:hypothetical protein
MRKPNLFIVGAPKSGTSSLRDWLGQHPDVFTITVEPCFFCNDIGDYRNVKDKKRYLGLFKDAKSEKYVVDKSALYLYSRESAKRIKDFSPNAKIIIILRNPKEQMVSMHKHLLYDGKETIKSFEKALKIEEKRKRGAKYLERFFYQDVANYEPQIERYMKTFGKKNVLVLRLENMKKNPEKFFKKVLNFLKLSEFKPDFTPKNLTKERNKRPFVFFIRIFKKTPYKFQDLVRKTFLKR